MTRRRRGGWWLVIVACVGAFPVAAWCCNVPVFRYALENWQPDSYQVLVLSRGELNEAQQQWLGRLEAAGGDAQQPANLQVHAIDLQQTPLRDALRQRIGTSPPPDFALEQLEGWAADQRLDEPLMVAFYPRVWDRMAWQATLSAENVEQLIDSPLRQEIARRLLDGQSAVWVLLESGDVQRDDQAWQVLQAELQRSMDVVELPAKELIETDEFYRPEVPIELRVEFSAVRLSASDPAERAFAQLLRGSESDLREFDDPIAIPIYGRGRTYFALVGAGLNGDTIEESGHFLCGACSCQIKEDNPGVDMLMAVNWADQVQGTAIPPVVLPELIGIGALDLAAQGASDTSPAVPNPVDATAAPSGTPAEDSERQNAVDAAAVERVAANRSTPGPSGSDQPSADGTYAAEPSAATSADGFQRRLLIGVAGGAVVAVMLLGLATFWLRRTL